MVKNSRKKLDRGQKKLMLVVLIVLGVLVLAGWTYSLLLYFGII